MSRAAIRQVPRSDATLSLRKCREFTDAAKASLAADRWNAAGLDAIHAGIAAGDAVLIAAAGIRSASKDHSATIMLLERETSMFAAAQRRQLAGLLKMKNQVAYDQRLLGEEEARQLVDSATRLLSWAVRVVSDADL